MSLFTVQCVTCKARLKVRRREAIGDIVGCPKCGSMVLVEPPPGWVDSGETDAAAAEGAAVDRAAAESGVKQSGAPVETKSKPAVGQQTAGAAAAKSPAQRPSSAAPTAKKASPPPTSESASAGHSSSTFDDAAALLSDEPPVQLPPPQAPVDITPAQPMSAEKTTAATGAAAESAAQSPSPLKEAASDDPPPATAEWTSPKVAAMRTWAMYGAAAVTGIVLAVFAVGFIVSRLSGETPEVVAEELPAAETPVDSPTDQSAVADEPAEKEQPPSSDKPPAADPIGNKNEQESPAGLPGPTRLPQPKETGGDSTDDPPASDKAAPAPDPSEPKDDLELAMGDPEPKDPPSKAAPAPVIDPDRDPEGGDADGNKKVDAPPLTGFEKFAPLFDSSRSLGQLPDAAPSPEGEKADGSDDAEKKEPERRPLPDVDARAQLAMKLAAAEYDAVPLVELVRELSGLTSVPITIEPSALTHARVAPTDGLSLERQTDVSVGELLERILGKYRLRLRVDGSHAIIEKAPPEGEAMRPLRYPMKDLGGEDPEALQRHADNIRRLIAPDSWEQNGGAGSIQPVGSYLQVNQSEAVHFQVLSYCEKLRVARGLAPKSNFRRTHPALFQLDTRSTRAKAKLEQEISLNFLRPTPLVQIIRRLEDAAEVTILVDWRAARRRGWELFSERTLTVDGQPLATALDELLDPMRLSYRAVSADVLQITSRDAISAQPELEFYPLTAVVAEADQIPRLVTHIKTTLAAYYADGDEARLHVDPVSHTLIAAVPQPQQRVIAGKLSDWRKSHHRVAPGSAR